MYSQEERLLRQAIAESLDDDTPRLIYADWLDEHGRWLEAEFVRVQLTSARLESLPRTEQQRHVALYRRQEQLLEQCQQLLLQHVPEALRSQVRCEFHRGLLCELSGPLSVLATCSQWVGDLIPLPRICLEDHVINIRRIIGGHPLELTLTGATTVARLETKTHLKTHSRATTTQDLAAVLDTLRTRELASGWPPTRRYGSSGAEVANVHQWTVSTEAVPQFPLLRVLDLSGAQLGDNNMQQLLQAADRFPKLHSLDVSANDLGDDSVAALLQTSWPRQLRRLILGGNLLTDRSAQLLVERWPVDSPLEDLNLRFTAIGHEGRRLLIHRFGGRVWLF
jgi:uncharacterized protein (TIGR02996 family)